jgi:phosphatidylglycerol---prolipoprotein diacylglyceryl transferase
LKIAQRYKTALRLREGDLFAIFMLAYFTYRLFVEFIKPNTPLFLNLTSIQMASLIAVIYYIYFFLKRTWSPRN